MKNYIPRIVAGNNTGSPLITKLLPFFCNEGIISMVNIEMLENKNTQNENIKITSDRCSQK